jgi:predicted RNA-binding Zn-ribbon protein involved in translation (DUF1610 family)
MTKDNIKSLHRLLRGFISYQKHLSETEREKVFSKLRDLFDIKDLVRICDTRGFELVIPPLEPAPLLLTCPACGQRHIDVGEFAAKLHKVHACQHCGTLWQPALFPTIGVQFLPGCKDGQSSEPLRGSY